jgi:hypothetical protein
MKNPSLSVTFTSLKCLKAIKYFLLKTKEQGGLNMKKIFTISLAIFYCFLGFADDPAGSWVVSNEGKLDVKKINFRDTKTKLILEDGKKLTISNDQIKSYSVNGRVYKKLQLYLDGKPSGKLVFMEMVKNQNDMILYRYNYSSYNPNLKIASYLLFKGDQMVFQYDEKSHRCALNQNP